MRPDQEEMPMHIELSAEDMAAVETLALNLDSPEHRKIADKLAEEAQGIAWFQERVEISEPNMSPDDVGEQCRSLVLRLFRQFGPFTAEEYKEALEEAPEMDLVPVMILSSRADLLCTTWQESQRLGYILWGVWTPDEYIKGSWVNRKQARP